MESRFHKIYNSYIVEQGETTTPVEVVPDPNASALPTPTEAAPDIADQQLDAEEQLDTSGFVTLVRLLKDAFVIKPDEDDADKILGIGEINGNNVYEKFTEVLSLIKKYNPEIDITTDLSKIK